MAGSTRSYVTEPATPLFPFGHGLSYTAFTLKGIAVSTTNLGANETFTVVASVASVGRVGKVVVQVYFSQNAPTKYTRYIRALLCFAKAEVPADSAGTAVTVTCSTGAFEAYDPDVAVYVLFSGVYELTVSIVDARDAGQSTFVTVQGNA